MDLCRSQMISDIFIPVIVQYRYSKYTIFLPLYYKLPNDSNCIPRSWSMLHTLFLFWRNWYKVPFQDTSVFLADYHEIIVKGLAFQKCAICAILLHGENIRNPGIFVKIMFMHKKNNAKSWLNPTFSESCHVLIDVVRLFSGDIMA